MNDKNWIADLQYLPKENKVKKETIKTCLYEVLIKDFLSERKSNEANAIAFK